MRTQRTNYQTEGVKPNPESELHIVERNQKPYVVLKEPMGVTKYVLKEVYDSTQDYITELKGFAGSLLNNSGGYLHAHDREDLIILLNEPTHKLVQDKLRDEMRSDESNLKWISSRAKKLRGGNVPPIFMPELEGFSIHNDRRGVAYTRFPNLDVLFNLFSRDYMGEQENYGRLTRRVNPHQIQFFRDYALREEFLDSVRKELQMRVAKAYKANFESEESKKFVLDFSGKSFDNLVRLLSEMPKSNSAVLRKYDHNTDPSDIVSKSFWYTQFNKSSVPLILEAYWKNFEKNLVSSDVKSAEAFAKGHKNLEYVTSLFPENSPDFVELNNNLRESKISRIPSYSELSEDLLSQLGEPQITSLTDRLMDDLRVKIKHGEISLYDLSNANRGELCEKVGIPVSSISRNLVSDASQEVQLALLDCTPHEDIIEYLNSPNFSVQHYPKVEEYLAQKIKRIVGTPTDGRNDSFTARARRLGFNKSAINRATRIIKKSK